MHNRYVNEDGTLNTQRLGRDAVDSQNACNIRGLSKSLHEMSCALDGDAKNPAVRLMVNQLAHLSGMSVNHDNYAADFASCEKMRDGN